MSCESTQMGLANSAFCEVCQQQTLNDVVNTCLWVEFEGRLQSLYNVGDNSHCSGNYSYCNICRINWFIKSGFWMWFIVLFVCCATLQAAVWWRTQLGRLHADYSAGTTAAFWGTRLLLSHSASESRRHEGWSHQRNRESFTECLVFMCPPSTVGGKGILFSGHPSSWTSVNTCCFVRDLLFLYLPHRFQWNLPQMFTT